MGGRTKRRPISNAVMTKAITAVALLLFASDGCARTSSRAGSGSTAAERARSAAVAQIEIISEQLPSGYRVVLARTPPVPGREPRIYIGSYVLQGTMQDTRLGWTHLMEHIAANNRSTIAGPPRPEGINIIESNALARPYYTSFVTVVPPALLPAMLHSRMARAGRAQNDSQVFKTEVGRVLAEVERDAAGQYPAYKALVSLALNKSPKLADELDLVRSTDRQDLGAAMAPIYRPDNAVLVIAGDADLAQTRALVHETDARLRLTEIRGASPVSRSLPGLLTGRSTVVESQNRGNHHVVGVGWPKPELGHPDLLPLLVADQLLLGRGESVEDPARSDASPVGVRLARALGGSAFSDARGGKWGPVPLIDTGPGLLTIIFNTDRNVTVDQVRDSVMTTLREIRRDSMSDAEIEMAKESFASFYERWFFEPTYRILSDHLMAYAVLGRNPERIKDIPAQIRAVRPAAVREVFDRYLVRIQPNVVILPHN